MPTSLNRRVVVTLLAIALLAGCSSSTSTSVETRYGQATVKCSGTCRASFKRCTDALLKLFPSPRPSDNMLTQKALLDRNLTSIFGKKYKGRWEGWGCHSPDPG
jgi:hypothetical protein